MKNYLVSSGEWLVVSMHRMKCMFDLANNYPLATNHCNVKPLRGFTSTMGFTPPREKENNNSFLFSSNVGGANPRPHRGFTLLLAVLVGSVLIALGFAIYNIASKDIILSSSGRESQFAFYAADSGTECALYWDYQHSAFDTTSALTEVQCGGQTVPLTRLYDPVTGDYQTNFSFSLGAALADPCSDVEIVKSENPTTTVVVASGYNTCVTTNPRRIERAIRVQY